MADTVPSPGPADLVEIYYAPSDVFARRREGAFWLPLFVLLIAMTVIFYATRGVMQPVFDAEWQRGLAAMQAKNPQVTTEQLEQGRSFMQGFAVVGVVISMFLGPLIAGVLLWIVCKFAGVRETLAAAITVAVFAFYPMLIEALVNAVQAAFVVPEEAITSRFSLSLGPARFMEGTSQTTLGLVGHIDLFTIWSAILIGIGVKVTGGATQGQAIAVAVVMWVLGALPALLGSAMG